MPKQKRKSETFSVHRAADWPALTELVSMAEQTLSPDSGEGLWFRGTTDQSFKLAPTLMRETNGIPRTKHDEIEQDLFFEFQAKSHELRSRNLTDWEYLFHGRHHGVPTRLIDWTETMGVAVYFALEAIQDAVFAGAKRPKTEPAIWMLNPYALNEKTWAVRDIVLPRYLGLTDDEEDYLDFGELLVATGKWAWNGPVAVYPVQLGDRVRAQRGWFTIHGNSRDPLEAQFPELLCKIVLEEKCIEDGLRFLEWAGFNKFSIYPDYDNLAIWLKQKNLKHLKSQARSAALPADKKPKPLGRT